MPKQQPPKELRIKIEPKLIPAIWKSANDDLRTMTSFVNNVLSVHFHPRRK
jgi:hypothetical protein